MIKKTTTRRDESGRIDEVTEETTPSPGETSAIVDAAKKVITTFAEDAVKTLKSRPMTITPSPELIKAAAKVVADQVTAEAKETARAALREAMDEIITEAKDEYEDEDRWVEDFKRSQDEDPYEEEEEEEEEEDPVTFRTEAGEAADLEDKVKSIVEPVTKDVETLRQGILATTKSIQYVTRMVDAIGYVLKECGGDREQMRRFFKYWNAQPLSKDHPYEAEPRLRVLRFPDSDAGRMSNETSDEYMNDDPEEATDQMALKPHHRRRQTVDDSETDAAVVMSNPDDLSGLDGSGGEDYRLHKNPQADAVLLSEQYYRTRKITKRRRKGWWSSID